MCEVNLMDVFSISIATGALLAGGILKGATGAGAPLIAVPALAALFDVPTAISIFCIPNLLVNFWQSWYYRSNQKSKKLVWGFAISGAVGVTLGTFFLTFVSSNVLDRILALMILLFLLFKYLNPKWLLARDIAIRLAPIVGFFGGVLQGMTGLSGPIILFFLNAMRLDRSEFIATIAVFFTITATPQIALLLKFNILTPNLSLLSFLALFPIILGLPLGQYLAKNWSAKKFDQIILFLLFMISIKLLLA